VSQTINNETDIVVFRMWKDNVIALFPYENCDFEGNVTSYMQIGQHGAANYSMIIAHSRPSTPNEYEDLKRELTTIGYNLSIRKRKQPLKRGLKQ
jgi:hypothetical protein